MRIQYLVNLIFFFTLYEDGVQRWRSSRVVIVPRGEPIDMEDGVNLEPGWQFESVVKVSDLLHHREGFELAGTKLGGLLVDGDILGGEHTLVSGLEGVRRELAGFVGIFLAFFGKAECSFHFFADLRHSVKARVEGGDVGVLSSWNSEVRSKPIEDFEGRVVIAGVYS